MAEMNMNPREKARLEEEKKNRKTRNKFILVGVIVVLMIALVIFVNSRLFYNVRRRSPSATRITPSPA